VEVYSEAEGVWLPAEVQGATADHTATVVLRRPGKGGGERLRETVDMRDASKVRRPADAAPSLPGEVPGHAGCAAGRDAMPGVGGRAAGA
jgi:hypothetical protein